MRNRLCCLFCFLCLLLLTACSGSAATYETISAKEAKTLMDSKTGYVILDVRTQEEFDTGHIPGAVLLPDTQVSAQSKQMLTDKKQLILVYCRSGRRSAAAAAALAELGYTNVKDFGGIIDWPYEVEQPEEQPICAEEKHQWLEDCTGRLCAICGKYERVTP